LDFRVELPAYRGPIDLLLYLVRKHEVDLTSMPLAVVVQQYVEFIDVLKSLDLSEVGDFIDLASTLLEMKSQAVLPQIEEEDDEPRIEDPQAELVERLLQYKQVRDAAAVLEEMGHRWQHRFGRLADDLPTRRVELGDQPIADLEIWDLVSSFGRLMRESQGPPATEVIYDETPIHVYMRAIHSALAEKPEVPLVDLVHGGIHKSALIGWFLATLELTRHHGAEVRQNEHGDVVVARTANYLADLNVNEVDNYGSTP